MITIIKKGTKAEKKPPLYVMTCDNCGCKFTYNNEDIEYSYLLESSYVWCPQCNYDNIILIRRKYRTKRFPFIGRKKDK